jgi:hypothetical protein
MLAVRRYRRSTTGFDAESCRDRFPERTNGIEKLLMQPLTGDPVFSLQLRRSCHPTTNGRHRNMRMRLKDINWSIKKLADGTTKTCYYAWRGGPRIDAEPGTPEFVRLYNEAVASHRKKSTETFSSLIDYFKDQSEFKSLSDKSERAYDGYLKLIEAKFGTMPIGAVEDRRARGDFKDFLVFRTTFSGHLRADSIRMIDLSITNCFENIPGGVGRHQSAISRKAASVAPTKIK